MFVDKMHSAAIRTADASGLPQTVYRVGNDWHHTEAMWARAMLRFNKLSDPVQCVPVITWLPANFFA